MLESKAKDLGRTIGQSEEYKAVKRSSEALNNDREATTVLRQMEKIRQDAQAMIDRGEEPTNEMEATPGCVSSPSTASRNRCVRSGSATRVRSAVAPASCMW